MQVLVEVRKEKDPIQYHSNKICQINFRAITKDYKINATLDCNKIMNATNFVLISKKVCQIDFRAITKDYKISATHLIAIKS
jgi:hypothetical protein